MSEEFLLVGLTKGREKTNENGRERNCKRNRKQDREVERFDLLHSAEDGPQWSDSLLRRISMPLDAVFSSIKSKSRRGSVVKDALNFS